MMNNRIMRIIGNTVGVAAIAALGITVYQLGTTPIKENAPEENMTMTKEEDAVALEEKETAAKIDKNMDKTHKEFACAEEEQKQDDLKDKGTEEDANEAEKGKEDEDVKNDAVDEDKKKEEEEVKNDTIEEEEWKDEEEIRNDAIEEVEEESKETRNVSAAAHYFPEMNFSEETLMEWPVNGNILVDYSMDQTTYFPTLDQYKLSPAISVQAVEGAPVMAAVNGTVFSVEQDTQTGTTVTMELGNGYQAIYGQLTNLAVAEGDMVKKGTIIGYVGAPTKYYSLEGSNLYFAMKKDGEPIDPIAYLP